MAKDQDRPQERSGGAFARDFAYLEPFLEKVVAHARGLSGAQGDRARELLAGEVERWKELRSLLAGNAPKPSAAAPPRGGTPGSKPPSAGPGAASAYQPTVGNLRQRPLEGA